jgi:glycosyltransferase involved in cell wall biosynthesis
VSAVIAAAREPGSPATAREPRAVVYVVASMITGGTQTHLLQVFRFLDRRRFTPHLFCLRDAGDLLDAARALGVPVATFGMRGTPSSPRDLVGLARMVARLRGLRPAVVHAYLLRGNFYGAVAARVARVPVVVTSKRGLHAPAGAAERIAVTVSNRLSDVITGNSEQVLTFTREVEAPGAAPLEMIPSGIDVERFDPARHRPVDEAWAEGPGPVIGSITTFKPRKGYRTLFEALARLAPRFPDVRLVVAGESRLDGEAAPLARRLGISDRLVLLGLREDVPRLLASVDLFVLPSETEGMSNALLEAMAMARPVIATAVSGNAEVVEDGRSGLLVPVGDAVALEAAVARLLRDPGMRRALGRAARRRVVDEYSAPAMVRRMEDLYARLLTARRA